MEMLIVGSKTKAFIKEQGCHTSSDFLDALNKKVMKVVEDACGRTKGNKRSTVKDIDL